MQIKKRKDEEKDLRQTSRNTVAAEDQESQKKDSPLSRDYFNDYNQHFSAKTSFGSIYVGKSN